MFFFGLRRYTEEGCVKLADFGTATRPAENKAKAEVQVVTVFV